ncbi:MAG: asparagine synthase-related protein [Planctomycetota bacterium]
MPGIIGLITYESDDVIRKRLNQGGQRLLRQPWHNTKSFVCPPFGIASIQLESRLTGGDLWSAEDESLTVAIDGELYFAPTATSSSGKELSINRPTSRCAEHIGALYCRLGKNWVREVRGAFAVTLFDRSKGELWLFSDRYGFRPLAYAKTGTTFIFGSTMASITAAQPEASWSLDWDAIADWFTFEHILGEKTFIEQIKLLPNAGAICFNVETKDFVVHSYWSMDSIPFQPEITFDEAVEEACRLFEKAIDEQAAGDDRLGVYLTSGLDSRTVAGYLWRRNKKFSSFTYGATGCRDMVWGEALARLLGSQHYSYPLDDGAWIPKYSTEFHAATESFANCYQASHGVSHYAQTHDLIDVHLNGYGGGSFAGGDTTSISELAAKTDEERIEELYKTYTDQLGNVFRYPIERYYLFTPKVRKKLEGRAEASMEAEVRRVIHLRPDIIGDAFTLNNRYKKLFPYLMALERDYFEERSPFMDYALNDFLFSIPTEIRLHRRLQLGMLDHSLQELTDVPWQVTTKPPTLDQRRLKSFERKAKYSRWFNKQTEPFEPGRNYALWLRQDGLEWARTILDSRRTEKHGVMNRKYLGNLVDRATRSEKLNYPEQRNLAFRIGAAISFELMCRLVLDHMSS